jgi:hypothetical protein
LKKEQVESRIASINSELSKNKDNHAKLQDEMAQTLANHSKLLGHLNEAQHWLAALLKVENTIEEVISEIKEDKSTEK